MVKFWTVFSDKKYLTASQLASPGTRRLARPALPRLARDALGLASQRQAVHGLPGHPSQPTLAAAGGPRGPGHSPLPPAGQSCQERL